MLAIDLLQSSAITGSRTCWPTKGAISFQGHFLNWTIRRCANLWTANSQTSQHMDAINNSSCKYTENN